MPTNPTLFGIPLGIDPAALLLAVVGLAIAIEVYRATTRHRARVVEVDQSWHGDARGHFVQFSVVVRNTGLPIHEPRFYLAFNRVDDDGRVCPTKFELGKKSSIFEHGVQARFGTELRLPISEYDRITAQWLQCFSRQTPRRTQPRLVIFSNEFEVVSIPLVSRFNSALEFWNRIAFWLNFKLNRQGKYKDGSDWVKLGNLLPILGLRAWYRLQTLSDSVNRELKSAPPAGQTAAFVNR